MKISREQVDHVARLARLSLSKEDRERYASQLSQILGYVEKLNELETSGVEPTSHVVPMANVFREDRMRPSLPQEKALENAPDFEEGFFRVPKIIE